MRRTPKILKLVFAVNVAFLLLFFISRPYVEAGSGAHVASMLALVPIVLMLSIIVVLAYFGTDIFDFE